MGLLVVQGLDKWEPFFCIGYIHALPLKSGSTLPSRDCVFKFFWYWITPGLLRTLEFNYHWSVYLPPNTSIEPLDQWCRYINGAFYSMERIVNAMGENPDGTSWKSGRIISFFDTEKAVKAMKPEIMNSCWNKLFRCCTWLNGIYDSQ